jgi:hypothetical protein
VAPSARIAAFLVGLTAVFGAAFGLGRAVGPVGSTDHGPNPVDTGHQMDGEAPVAPVAPVAPSSGPPVPEMDHGSGGS